VTPRRLARAAFLVAALALSATAAAIGSHNSAVSSGYYRLRPDPRLCPSPLCGGFWASRVNQARTPCRGGKPQPACYVAAVDLSALPPDARARAEAALAGGRVLIRGRIGAGSVPHFPSLGRLVATEVWLSATTRPGAGTVYRIVDNGVRCITTPCFSLRAFALNTARRVALSDLDLALMGAPRKLVGRAQAALTADGLVVAGQIRAVPDAGPAGTGRALGGTQFWLLA
jgi:Domain of unknown function (DUF6748)